MYNFEYLKKEKNFDSFSDAAIIAEKSYQIDATTCALNCRKALELAVKWMYSVDRDLKRPYQCTLNSLISSENFKSIIDEDLFRRIKFIQRNGNDAAHSNKKLSEDIAELCLENLFYFMDFINYCYGEVYEKRTFDRSLLMKESTDFSFNYEIKDTELKEIIDENIKLKKELTAHREKRQESYVVKPIDFTEKKTRELYIDTMLRDAGWIKDVDWEEEKKVYGMPSKSGMGRIDYVLYDDTHRPLAIIEAKKTSVDVSSGRRQAEIYADILEKEYKRRPIIFLTNGYDTRINDAQYPERKVSSIYSKRDLEKLFNLRNEKRVLNNIEINEKIVNRYYQINAIKATCESYSTNRRKTLLVMATGSGKTRTAIALVDVLIKYGWIKNVLFLADRTNLITQAKRNFDTLLEHISTTNLSESKENSEAHIVFSTYQTMMNCIDTIKNDNKKLYTCGHFDLIICDEAHRSIYNKYKDIFTYFDSLLVGLTATPKEDVAKNTYEVFDLENKVPTYAYDYAQAVKDKNLVDYQTIETKLKFLTDGIVYDDLSEEDQKAYEETFLDEDGELPEKINSSALNNWIFNEDTIRKVLELLMDKGIHIDYGHKIGKTIIFAKNHKHAETILNVFNKTYPNLAGYAEVIDNYLNYAQKAIDEFSEADKLPQIAISVDMLDTGVDVPEIVNLVFFKNVLSKAKFWQMIGRGTRLCKYLMDGEDKSKFYIFDFCGNFEFFKMSKGKETDQTVTLQGALFSLKFDIVYHLQKTIEHDIYTDSYRMQLINELIAKIIELDRNNFAVRQHLKYIDAFSNEDDYNDLSYEDTLIVKSELAPLIIRDDEINAIRFDALMYRIELSYIKGEENTSAIYDLKKKATFLLKKARIPGVKNKIDLLNKIVKTDYIDHANLNDFETIRIELRDLMKHLIKEERKYITNFDDEIISIEYDEADLENDDLRDYKAKIEYYIKQHQLDNIAIQKIKSNIPLNQEDIKNLEDVVWYDLGTREEYESKIGKKPLGEFIRNIVGLDMEAAKNAFSQFLNDTSLNSNQIYFINQIVEYIVRNGVMKDMTVLQDSPFTDYGSISDVFSDSLSIWSGIKNTIDEINRNAMFIV